MKIVVAPDSFKGSLTSTEASQTMKKAILDLGYEDTVVTKPMADGGEGTVDALLTASEGTGIPITCTGPLGEKINTYYGILEDQTAIIEVANVAGLPQVPATKRNPDATTTYGLGEVILDALNRGCKNIIIGLGGSATNDAGLGMLLALGMEAFDKNENPIGIFGRDLANIDRINVENLEPRLNDIQIQVACDVDNPLYGEKGASAVYGPQKGAKEEQIMSYDTAMKNFASLIDPDNKNSFVSGAGAAGGLGFAFLTLGANLVSGAELVGEASAMEQTIRHADLVITGEGQSDEQTLYGKAPGYIADLANAHGIPVILLSGALSRDIDPLLQKFSGCYSITNRPLSLESCMDQAEDLLYQQTKQVVHLVHRISEAKQLS
ncbi:glycerate kinase [Oceanobacillus limi]|uniref:Glycerate kinase n=1 Tax=Oceanobacillus limi TaxID=930131 RepID=A0A1I0ADN1_9BACI|nr:glycerate kinase [Oceanobacillus limi]SES92282.1 glycerate kinase [Oceanobacillus limi]